MKIEQVIYANAPETITAPNGDQATIEVLSGFYTVIISRSAWAKLTRKGTSLQFVAMTTTSTALVTLNRANGSTEVFGLIGGMSAPPELVRALVTWLGGIGLVVRASRERSL